MSESVLAILKLCFLAVLYLFVARVVRAVWVEIFAERSPVGENRNAGHNRPAPTDKPRTNATTQVVAGRQSVSGRRGGDSDAATRDGRKGRQGRRQPADHMVIVEPPDQRGTVFALADEMTVGRGAGCAIYVQDTFASGMHARVFRRESQYFVEDLGSTNGTWLNRKRVHGPIPLRAGDRIQVGNTVLEMRA